MNIRVDIRESELIEQIKRLIDEIPSFKNLELKIENLPLGDVIISKDSEDKLVIERKTVHDLMASIKDGRYEEQSYRLSGMKHHNHNIIYLIEGDINRVNRFKENYIDKITLYSAIFSLNHTKGFSVIRTFSLSESAIFICNSASKLIKNEAEKKKAYYSLEVLESEETSEKDYVSVIKKIKKENITANNIDEIMLCQIPGISSITAIAIISKFLSISNLINSVKEDENSLNEVVYENEKGKLRKINKTCIENIKKYLVKI